MKLYLAYGSNCNVDQMESRCPLAIPVSGATLRGWQFKINARGVATITSGSDTDKVEGALWNLTAADEATLDRYEGVKTNAYTKVYLDVVTDDGETVEALVYIDFAETSGTPREGYIETCIEGAREWSLDHAVAEMERHPYVAHETPQRGSAQLDISGLYDPSDYAEPAWMRRYPARGETSVQQWSP